MNIVKATRIRVQPMSSVALWAHPLLPSIYCLEPGPDRLPHPGIPPGEYRLRLRSAGYKHVDYANYYAREAGFPSGWHRGMVEICEVPGREAIEFHVGNFITDTLGCSVCGLHYGNDTDGNFRVDNSRLAYEKAYPVLRDLILGGETWLHLENPEASA